jgi:hypothetical protein
MMTADEIREYHLTAPNATEAGVFWLREIAAQLAEMNEKLKDLHWISAGIANID